jgi:hypothetical protein
MSSLTQNNRKVIEQNDVNGMQREQYGALICNAMKLTESLMFLRIISPSWSKRRSVSELQIVSTHGTLPLALIVLKILHPTQETISTYSSKSYPLNYDFPFSI